MKSPALLALVLALVFAPACSFAQETAPACPTAPAPLPPEYAGWTAAMPVTAATIPADLAKAQIAVSSRADVALLSTTQIQFVSPEKAPAPGSHGGMVGFTVPLAHIYRVALGAGAWIDVVRDGKPVMSGAHGHGPACTAIRKTVDFALTPGDYVLQITGSKDPAIAVMILPLLP